MAKWNAGDIVRLKSGGPDMTVDGYVSAMPGEAPCDVVCKWFMANKQEKGTFHENALEASSGDDVGFA